MDLVKIAHLLAILAPLLAYIAWQLDEPIPDGFEEKRKLRISFAGIKLFALVAQLLDYLQLYPLYKSLRYMSDFVPRTVPKVEGLSISNQTFDGVPVRIYSPEVDREAGYPAVVFYHGGGFTTGSVEQYHGLMAQLGMVIDIIIVSVEYRLAPEVTFPIPVEDCEKATKYFLTNARKFGADPHRVAIMGESAGGNFAAAVSLKLRDANFRPMPKRQVLIYPPLQSVDFTLPSFQQYGNGPPLKLHFSTYLRLLYAVGSDYHRYHLAYNEHVSPRARAEIYSKHLRHEDLEMDYHYSPYKKPDLKRGSVHTWLNLKSVFMNPYFSPLLADDFSRLPETCIVTVHYDMLRDDGLLYVQKLRKAGVKVNHIHVTHAYHGVWSLADVFTEGRKVFNDVALDLKKNL